MNNQRFVNHPETFRNYFVIQFDRPFEEYGLWENEHDERFPGMTEGEGKGYGAYVRFKAGTKVQARAASSYISPEQASGAFTDARSDIYSVGVMMFEMLTGKLPFEADTLVSVAVKQIQSQPALPRSINPDIPEGLQEIVMRAMQKDPARRYQSAARCCAASTNSRKTRV